MSANDNYADEDDEFADEDDGWLGGADIFA